MENKTLSTWWLASLGFLVFVALIESDLSYDTSNTLYGIGAVSVYISGIWGAIRLRK